jgi:hypothetical protein
MIFGPLWNRLFKSLRAGNIQMLREIAEDLHGFILR